MDLGLLNYSLLGCGLPDMGSSTDVFQLRHLREGETLFRAGQPFEAIYIVRSGSFSTAFEDRTGARRVISFHFSGDLFGTDASLSDKHVFQATALELSQCWVLPRQRLRSSEELSKEFLLKVAKAIGRSAARDQLHVIMMGKLSAEQRIAIFLNDLAVRRSGADFKGAVIHLPMTRTELASYLGLAPETVSRNIARMDRSGIIDVRGRTITISLADELSAVASGCASARPRCVRHPDRAAPRCTR